MLGTVGDISCRELVELVTDYFEGALPKRDRRRFDEHIAGCDNCTVYLEQMRITIAASGRIEEGDIEPAAREALLSAFRDWNRRRGA
jgi:anti-sigma factor RsiW